MIMIAPRKQPPLLSLVDELLAEQGRLQTPVVLASRAFDQSRIENPKPRILPQLIPLSAPAPGEQYAFEVDLDSCSGCKACVVACHSLNGLDDTEAWRDVGCITGGSPAAPYQQTITTACHHCADPGCLNGCPVLAYEKDPLTGIVRHLDDQCIGCQYCILKCPYDVPKYNERLGIVRKCDMCHQRLGAGEAPACVQACPTHAISIVKVTIHGGGVPSPRNDSPRADTSSFLPTAPDPAYTQPTTRYVSRQPLPANAQAADASALRPQHPHWPLVIMLTLLPVSVGCYTAAALATFNPIPFVTHYVTNIGWATGALGLAASVFHLGQPLRAWRIFLGWRTSWLSREAMVFGAWFGLATTAAVAASDLSPIALPLQPLLAATATTGLAGLFCSVMIYADTHRTFWRFSQTAPRFLGTALVGGLAFVAPAPAALALVAKLSFEALALHGPAVSARLLRGPLRRAVLVRCGLGCLGLLALLTFPAPGSVTYYVTLAVVLAGEMAERYLFFRAVDAPKMPGVPRA